MVVANTEPIATILHEARVIAVVGLSPRPDRPSHAVSSYMQSHGYRIIPINPSCSEILHESCYPSLLDLPEGSKIDIVNVFRRSETVGPIIEQAIRIGARCVWMQEGVWNPQAAHKAEAAGLDVVMNRCIMRDHRAFVLESP
jgi:predicted CoA-binding protein